MLDLRLAKFLSSILVAASVVLFASSGVFAKTIDDGVRADLPLNNVLRVENPRGNIQVEVWSERYVSVSTSVKGEQPKGAPVAIERTEEALLISVSPQAVGMLTRVDLTLRIPERSRARLTASVGEINIQGVPAELSAQNVSGNIRTDFSAPVDADIQADAPLGK